MMTSYAPSVNELKDNDDSDDDTYFDTDGDDDNTENGASISTATAETEAITEESAETSRPAPEKKAGRPCKCRSRKGNFKSSSSVSQRTTKRSRKGSDTPLSAPRKREAKRAKGKKKTKRAKVVVDFGGRKLRLVEERLLI